MTEIHSASSSSDLLGMALFFDGSLVRGFMAPILFLNQSMFDVGDLAEQGGIARIGQKVSNGRNAAVDAFIEQSPAYVKSLFGDFDDSLMFVWAVDIDKDTLQELHFLSETLGVREKRDPYVWLQEHLEPYVTYSRLWTQELSDGDSLEGQMPVKLPAYIGGGVFWEDQTAPLEGVNIDPDLLCQYQHFDSNCVVEDLTMDFGGTKLVFVNEAGKASIFFIRSRSIEEVLVPLSRSEGGRKMRDMYLHYCGFETATWNTPLSGNHGEMAGDAD